MSKEIIRIENLYKKYKDNENYSNENINLTIYENQIYGLLGPNGAGKTTLVRQITGLLKPTKGSILIKNNNVIKNQKSISKYISYFGQQMFVLDSHRVWESIYYTGIFRGLNKDAALKQTNLLIDLFEINEIRNKLVSNLSGGQKKIVGLLSVLIGFNPIIILDEPTNELDPSNRVKLWNILKYLKEKFKLTIILVTHNILEAEKILDKAVIINKGKIIGEGTPETLKEIISNECIIDLNVTDINAVKSLIVSKDKVKFEECEDNRLKIITSKDNITKTVGEIINNVGSGVVKDLRIVTPSLEDVYLYLGGESNGFK